MLTLTLTPAAARLARAGLASHYHLSVDTVDPIDKVMDIVWRKALALPLLADQPRRVLLHRFIPCDGLCAGAGRPRWPEG